MTLAHKIMLGTAAMMLAGAASFPTEVASFYREGYPADPQKREALSLCQQTSSTFVRFLPGDREACYTRMKNAGRLS